MKLLISVNYIDIILIIPLLWGIYKGFTKGFIIQVSTLAALILGIYGAIKLAENVSARLKGFIEANDRVLMLISFAAIFLLIVIAVHFFAKILEKFISIVALGFVNKLLGAIFGLLKAGFILSVVLMLINMADEKFRFIPSEEKSKSLLYEPVSGLVPAVVPGVKDYFKIALIPGSSFPSIYSSIAPPPVDT